MPGPKFRDGDLVRVVKPYSFAPEGSLGTVNGGYHGGNPVPFVEFEHGPRAYVRDSDLRAEPALCQWCSMPAVLLVRPINAAPGETVLACVDHATDILHAT